MRTAAIGGGMARERAAAGPAMHTHVSSQLAVVVDSPRTPTRGWVNPSGGATLRETDRRNENAATLRGGFEWTGARFPLRIPTAVKVRVARKYRELLVHLRRVPARDWLSLISIATLIALAWSLLWS